MNDRRATGGTLFLCLAASQAAILVLSPVLAPLASDLDVSTAVAGQLRTVSGLAAGVTALLAGLVAARVGLRDLLGAGLLFLALGSGITAAAPDFAASQPLSCSLGSVSGSRIPQRSPPWRSGPLRRTARRCSLSRFSARRLPGSWACPSAVSPVM